MLQLPHYFSLKDKLKHYHQQLIVFWSSLNLAQRCYFLAILCSILYLKSDTPSTTLITAITTLVLVAMISEFWPKFTQIWDSLPGKAVILLFYGFVANYSLVQASGAVNNIAGVSAEHLPYTHNFAVLLSVPVWFFITSLVVLLIIQFTIPIYIFILLLLRPFGLHTIWHAPNYRFAIITGLIRFGAGLFLLVQLALLSTYTGALKEVSKTVTNITNGLETDLIVNIQDPKAQEKTSALKENPELARTLSELDAKNDALSQRATAYEQKITNILSHFIFDHEADLYSRCDHTKGSRIIELNDYEILEIIRHNATENTHYTYQVKPCISAAIGHQFKPQKKP
ncbi:hypothetical protein PSECIP111951_03301 [Pseudoalteromonas holothuriae]|uniref:Uncharacterized protein n=1 Tax=Pseudoalteromonas holothuriae TaxID=2963714 RepID=A0ABN8URY9_9GAMM|nr:hypothetical protein [Pseudoalteromonas sp. CIP111951]CAH9065174.1 hypothetical protein PSECIP111951_03301 [Pseudoalteromonas sp. CIP111951]